MHHAMEGSRLISSPTQRCYFCGQDVQPTAESYCPSCARRFKVAEEGQTEFEVSPPSGAKTSPSDHLLTKIMIVIFVFPMLAWVISALAGLVLSLPAFLLPKSGAFQYLEVVMWVAEGVGLVGAFLISRRIWPPKVAAVQW